jgi:long-chain fatty acid transport protein
LNFGAVYRSKTEHNIKGDFQIQDAGVNGYTDSRFSADVTLPAYANAGLSYKLGKLTIAGGLMWTNWSSYDRLEAVFSHNQGVPGINETDRLSSDKKWDDTLAYKFGVEYAISDAWDLRAGILFDPTPVPDHTLDPLVPSGDRWDYSIGFGYKKKALRIDCAYLLVTDEGRRFDNAVSDQSAYGLPNVTGKFDDFVVHALTVNVNYTF